MSVHTLCEEDGMVTVAATVTKAEALEAGMQILGFCYGVNALPKPIVLDRPEIIPTCRVPCQDGLVEVFNGQVVFAAGSGASYIVTDPAGLAAALAAVSEHTQFEPDPDEVDRVVASMPATVPPTVAREAALSLLRRYTVEERVS